MNPRAPADNSPAQRDFFALACELEMIDEATAAALRRESTASDLAPGKVAQRQGAMSAVQIDIVETLQQPLDVAPGYEIASVIGHGGMGVVYRARQVNLDRPVALKTVLLSQMNDPNFAARFEQEALAVGRLRHPNIVAAYDFGRHRGRLFLAMELFEGEDADSRVRRMGPFSERQAFGVARQAAAGLAQAAQAGIVHRDVKPANLLLAPAPEGFQTPAGAPMVKIADFGLAFLDEQADSRMRLTSAHAVIGSPNYMAPEQLGGESIDFRADIYALGATLWHLIAGEPPFNETAVSKIVVRKLQEEAPALRVVCPTVSVEAERIVSRMLSRRREDRFDNYQALLAEFDRLLGGGQLSDSRDESFQQEFIAAGAATRTRLSLAAAETSLLPQAAIDSAPLVEGKVSSAPPTSLAKRNRRRRAAIAGASALCILSLALGGIFFATRPRALPNDRVLAASGRSSSLFDGRSMRGWINETGEWRIKRTAEGVVLSGKNGVVRRAAALPTDSKPLAHYRLIFIVRRQQAEAIEVRFGETAEGRSHVLRIDGASSRLGVRDGPSEPFKPREAMRPLRDASSEAAHVVHLERQRDNWWIFVDEHLAAIAAGEENESPYFSFASEGGPAHFSDVAIEELTAVKE